MHAQAYALECKQAFLECFNYSSHNLSIILKKKTIKEKLLGQLRHFKYGLENGRKIQNKTAAVVQQIKTKLKFAEDCQQKICD